MYKDASEKLLDYKTFTKMISKSAYIIDSDSHKHYKAVKIKVWLDSENKISYKNKKMFILKIDEIKKLEMDNIFPEDIDENGFEEDLDNVIPFN